MDGRHSPWSLSLLFCPLHWLRIKPSFYFLQTLCIFHSALVGRESQDSDQQQSFLSYPCSLTAFCLWKNFSQRIGLVREEKTCNKGK